MRYLAPGDILEKMLQLVWHSVQFGKILIKKWLVLYRNIDTIAGRIGGNIYCIFLSGFWSKIF